MWVRAREDGLGHVQVARVEATVAIYAESPYAFFPYWGSGMEKRIARLSVFIAVTATVMLMVACDSIVEREGGSSKTVTSERLDEPEATVSGGPLPTSDVTGPAIPAQNQENSASEAASIAVQQAFEVSEAWSSEVLGFAIRGDISPLGPYQLTEPKTGEPLQLEFVMVTARPDNTTFVVRMRNVGEVPLHGYFRLTCSTSSGRTGITVEPMGLASGRTMHEDLFIRGESTTQGECSLQQEDDWRRLEPS